MGRKLKKGHVFMKSWKRIFSIKSLKSRLILYNQIIIITIALFFNIYNFISYRNNTINLFKDTSLNNTKMVANRLHIVYEEMVNIILSASERKSLFFSLNTKDLETPSGKRIAINGSQILNDYIAISGYSEYIAKATLYQEGGVLLQSGYIAGAKDDAASIMASDWFHRELDKNINSYHLSLVDSPFWLSSEKKILPMMKELNYSHGQNGSNWILLSISTNLHKDILKEFDIDNAIYSMTYEGDIIASIGDNHLNTEMVRTTLLDAEVNHGTLRMNIDARDCFINYTKDLNSGIIIYEILPLDSLSIDHTDIISTIIIIFISCLLIGLLLSILISRKLNRPISLLLSSIQNIAQGDFTKNKAIERNDEIGLIGKYVNKMSSQISSLMDTRVQIEKEKKDLEIKMLQAQINPHFLYNTLDSIRWMAMIQKNTGIVKTIGALSSLLKRMAKSYNEKTTLEKELEFLEDYITIEKVRYMELFDLKIDVRNPDLYKAKIITLTLQPIVENSIFSGIEPSGRNGIIHITVYSKKDTLFIEIKDNGVGIPPELIPSILSDTNKHKKNSLNGIGLPNVNQRIKLNYGGHYGISIKSKVNEYTVVTITLPLEYD